MSELRVDSDQTSISMSVVFYNNSLFTVDSIVSNLIEVTKKFSKKRIFLINNSLANKELSYQLEEICNKYDFFYQILPESNKGFGGGHNCVLPYLTSEYHFVINPDIFIPNEYVLKKIVEFLNQHPEYGLLSPLIKYPDGKIQHLLKLEATVLDMALRFLGLPIFKKRQDKFINLPDGYNHTHDAKNIPGSFMVFRTSVFREINGFDEKFFLYMEDSDITMSVNQISKTIFFNDVEVVHEWQRANRKSVKGILIMLRSMIIYFNKWGWKLW